MKTHSIKVYVYRLEKNSRGPFEPRDKVVDETMDDPNYECKLAPRVNFKVGANENWPHDFIFGCYSLTQLKDYFGMLWKPLIGKGYKIKLYEVDYKDVRWSEPFQELAFNKNGKFRRVE